MNHLTSDLDSDTHGWPVNQTQSAKSMFLLGNRHQGRPMLSTVDMIHSKQVLPRLRCDNAPETQAKHQPTSARGIFIDVGFSLKRLEFIRDPPLGTGRLRGTRSRDEPGRDMYGVRSRQ